MKNIVLLICLIVCNQMINAQANVKFNIIGEKLEEIGKYKKLLPTPPPVKILPEFNLDSVLQEDTKRIGLPFRYGYEFKVQYSPLNSGKWEVENNVAIWRLKVKSSDAYSLAFHFSKFYLPATANLIIYNEEESFLYGPLTAKQNNEKNKFTTGPVQGDNIILELSVSAKLKDSIRLEISRIIHGYVNILPTNSNSSAKLDCHNNVACHSAWDDESDAVAKLIMGTSTCSGSLQNNTANDYRAFLLTAFHCVDSDHDGDYDGNDYDVDDYVFHFHYKSPCEGTSAGYVEYNSSNYLAGWSNSDFALVELDDSPVGNADITWLGWDNRANTPTSGTCIHHPLGDIMKISFDNNTLTTNNQIIYWDFGPPSPISTHWVVGFDNGAVDRGSSGAPLFNQNSKVVGQFHGGQLKCPPTTDYFGRFDVSWGGGGTSPTQLAHWLDPNDTGNPTTNLLRSPSLDVPNVICYSGHTISILNPPLGVTITWGGVNVSYPYGNTGTSVTVRASSSTTSANGTVTASFSVNDISYTITHTVWAGTPQVSAYGGHIVDIHTGMPLYDLCYGTANEAEAIHPAGDAGITDWDWRASYGQVYPYGADDEYATIYPNSYQSFMLEIRAGNACGYSGWAHMYTNVVDCDRYLLVFTPNPTTGETTLSIESKSKEKTFDEAAEWEMEIYSQSQLLMEKKNRLYGQSASIQTAGWKEGVYIVRVLYKGEVLTGRLIVAR